MPRPRSFWRSIFATTLLLALIGTIAPAPASAQPAMATLTIHSRFCPPNYGGDDLFGDCHDNPGIQGIQFGISGGRSASGTPDTEGNLSFSDLPPGGYRITSTAPADKQLKPAVYCSAGDGSTATQAESSNDSEAMARIELAAGASIICDWYTIPTDDFNATHGNLTIHNRFCPMGYSGDNFFEDCHDSIGIAYVGFQMSGPERAWAMIDVGDATFTWLTAGDYNLSSDGSLVDVSGRLICSAFDHAGTPFLDVSISGGGPVGVEIHPGTSTLCDWYVFPTPEFYNSRSEISLSAVQCEAEPDRFPAPQSGQPMPEGCVSVPGITVSVYPYLTGPGEFGDTCTTNDRGGCFIHVRNQVPLNGWVDEADWPEGYGLNFNPFYVQPQYTEFAHITVMFLPE